MNPWMLVFFTFKMVTVGRRCCRRALQQGIRFSQRCKAIFEAADIATSKMKSGRSDANSSQGKSIAIQLFGSHSLTNTVPSGFQLSFHIDDACRQTRRMDGRSSKWAASMTDTKFPVMGDIFEDNLTFSIAALETPEVEVSP